MENRRLAGPFCSAILILFGVSLAAEIGGGAENDKLLTGKAAMGDSTSDAPGVRRKITVEDLPAPSSNVLAINPPRVAGRPVGAQLNVPPGLKIGVNFDSTKFIEDSTDELKFNLVMAAILTAVVCWFFLGSFSSAFNIILAIPTSIVVVQDRTSIDGRSCPFSSGPRSTS